MEALFKHATIAWNPMGETRRRLTDSTLNVGAVLIPFLAVVIACNLAAHAAQSFFLETLEFWSETDLTGSPLFSNDFAQRTLSALGVLVPAAAVAVLPASTFAPVGRGPAVASIFVLGAAWAFYGAAFTIPVYFVAGVLASADPETGIAAFLLLNIPASLAVLGLTIWFWIRVFRTVLGIRGGAVALISVCAVGSLAVLAGLLLAVLSATPM